MALDLSSGRYVFFKSMKNSKNPELYNAYKNAGKELGHTVSNIFSQMESHYNSETDRELNSIKSYMDFVDYMVDVEGSAVDDFLRQQIGAMKKESKDKELQTLAAKFEEFLNGPSKEDPTLYVKQLNELLQGSKTFEDNVKTQFSRIRSNLHNWEELSEETKASLEQVFEESYDNYRTGFSSAISQLTNKDTGARYFKSLSTKMSSVVKLLLKNVCKNLDFLSGLYDSMSKNVNITDSEFKSIVVNTVVQQVVEHHITQISEEVSSGINDMLAEIAKDKAKIEKTLEEDYDKLT